MVKKREGKRPTLNEVPNVSDEALSRFMDEAEGYAKSEDKADPRAKRDYKQINVRVNEYEYQRILIAAEREHMKVQDFLRVMAMRQADS